MKKEFINFCQLLSNEQRIVLCEALRKLAYEDDYCDDEERLLVIENAETVINNTKKIV